MLLLLTTLTRGATTEGISSHRIGNLVSAWWFSAQLAALDGWFQELELRTPGGGEAGSLARLSVEQCPRTRSCFGARLAAATSPQLLNLTCRAALKGEWIRAAGYLFASPTQVYVTRILGACGGAVLQQLGADLRRQMEQFAPGSLRALHESHCVVHFRVGDFLNLKGALGEGIPSPGVEAEREAHTPERAAQDEQEQYEAVHHWIIHPESIAAAVASFTPRPETIEILDGGAGHMSSSSALTDQDLVARRSAAALSNLTRALQSALPNARVYYSHQRSADEDLFRLAAARLLVLAGGSFGLVGAAAGAWGRQQVRLPSAEHHLDLFRGMEAAASTAHFATMFVPLSEAAPPPSLPDGWKEYLFGRYTMRDDAHETPLAAHVGDDEVGGCIQDDVES